MSTIDGLNAAVADFQRGLIDQISEAFLADDKGVLTRSLHLKHGENGKRRVMEALRPLSGSVIYEAEDHQHGSRYRPTYLGILLGRRGPEYEQLVVRFVEFVEKTVLAQNDRTELRSEEIDTALGLNTSQSRLLYRLLRCTQLWNPWSQEPVDGPFSWGVSIIEHGDELPSWPSKRDFVRHRTPSSR